MTNKKAEASKRKLLKQTADDKNELAIAIDPDELWELAHIMDTVIEHGGMFSIFTSRDQNAFCIQVKFGKDSFRSWQSVMEPHMSAVDAFWQSFQEESGSYKLTKLYQRKQ